MMNVLMFSLLAAYRLTASAGDTIQERNCHDVWNYQNIRHSGIYQIDVDGDGPLSPIWVYCEMLDDNDPHQVMTVIHHDTEIPVQIRDYESAGSYAQNITYNGATEEHLTTLIDSSFSCQQYIKWACKGSMFGFWYPKAIDSWWVGRNWKDQYYWGGAETDSGTCECHPYCYETKRNSTCNCDSNHKLKWLDDSGLLLNSKRLPVLQLRFGDTGESNEAGEHTLGPLKCRATGHKDIFKDVFKAPCKFITPGFKDKYPAPFLRQTWTIQISEGEYMELVFPEYDVVHYGAYNDVTNCRNVVTILAQKTNTNEIVTLTRQKSPPYYVSDGSETTLNITLTTCNQDPKLKLGKGFKAHIRKAECAGCNIGLEEDKGLTVCNAECGIIASNEYPFPFHYYFTTESSTDYTHTWILRSVRATDVVELEFRDFDIPAVPGSRNCTPESGILWVYDGEVTSAENLIGGYCNLNQRGFLYSFTNTMTLVFTTKLRKVGNGRGFCAFYRSVPPPEEIAANTVLTNIAEGKPAKQSSTRDSRSANLALDSLTDSASGSAHCTATEYEKEPWWQVNLQKRYLIYGFELHSMKSKSQYNVGSINKNTRSIMWPEGQYGLPMPVSGCPNSAGFKWETGCRYHDMQYDTVQDDKVPDWSEGILLKGGLQKNSSNGVTQRRGVLQYFCMKNQTLSNHTYPRVWPPGEYCIYQYGRQCPSGFESGYITWIDTKQSPSNNKIEGCLPSGNYTQNTTTIYFCCRSDGSAENYIELPTTSPFYLLTFGGKLCQKVKGMTPSLHYFHFNEDVEPRYPSTEKSADMIDDISKYGSPHPFIDKSRYEKGISLHYCYYDITDSLRGFRITVDETGLRKTLAHYYDDLSFGIHHKQEGMFLNAYTCYVYPVTNEEFSVLRANCSQPIYGQYVTLQVYNRFDSLQFCEMKIFGKEACGQPLGMASEEIFDNHISSSSTVDTNKYYYTSGRLNADHGWCAKSNDTLKQFTVTLQSMTKVTGIVLQGLNGAHKETCVKKFQLFFLDDLNNWTYEEEPVGQQKIYVSELCAEKDIYTNDLEIRFNLLKAVTAKVVQLKILEYSEKPCLRLEILGCRDKVKCQYNLNEIEGNVSSPNYPSYYGQDKSCWWIIDPGPKKHVDLNFIVYDIAAKEDSLDSSACRDELTVYPKNGNSLIIKSPDGKLFPKRIISNGKMKIHLSSCFRYSRSRYRGFDAHYKLVDCPGCGVGDFHCIGKYVCESSCGKIISIGHPLNYQNNHRCSWLIRVNETNFVNLTFQDFDIVGGENCTHDYLAVYDGERSDIIGRYCNANKPPLVIVSSWNTLFLEFSSDTEHTGRGFSLKYTSSSYQMPADVLSYNTVDDEKCPETWKYYNGYCYKAFHENDTLQWHEAESKCRTYGGKEQNAHLVSILDKKENEILHTFLIHDWKAKQRSLYIGLNDKLKEGVYRWSDRNPMIFTNWAPGRSLLTQPDGGAYQDCTMLSVNSGHTTAHWHDIPCSLGKLSFNNSDDIDWGKLGSSKAVTETDSSFSINSYICKMQSDNSTGNSGLSQFPSESEVESILLSLDKERYFICENKEIISRAFVCNLVKDCKNGSDEANCSQDECPQNTFRCDNTNCVSFSAYCDYKDDCGDFSDESRCSHRECQPHEFRCTNGQCIPFEERCDLLENCFDNSDEEDCVGSCSPNRTFQCYDGTCIPRYALCDGYRDCPGKYHEDEQPECTRKADREGRLEETKLCSKRARKTCLDLYMLDNIRKSGYYVIDSDGSDGPIAPFEVYCYIDETTGNVTTIVHHDSEKNIYVRSGRDGPGTYRRNLTYSIGLEKVRALTKASKYCFQFISWECSGTGFHFESDKPWGWWVSWNGQPQYTWGGAKKNGTCGCYETGCKNISNSCNCDSVDKFEWATDEGYLNDKDILPVKEVRFGYTFQAGQYGYHRIGVLECIGNAQETEESCTNTTNYIKCSTGHYVSIAFKCIYEFDEYESHVGCRDVTHLRQCENFVCPKGYVKCPGSYCIPIRYVCNGQWDCMGGGDEKECDSYSCPGHYKCHNYSSCLPVDKLCDGKKDCPNGDDELLCDMVCPENCVCYALFVSCSHQNASELPSNLSHEVRKLDFSFNHLDLEKTDFSHYWTLGELILQHNDLCILPGKRFEPLRNLYKLDLSNNKLIFIETSAFEGLVNVRLLILENNPTVTEIKPKAFDGLDSLTTLNLTGTSLRILRTNAFYGMPQLKTLNLQNNNIEKIETGAFAGLHSVTVLNLENNPSITEIETEAFHDLSNLTTLNLTGKSLRVLRKRAFHGMSSLRILNLQNNNIGKVESGAFNGLHSMTLLDIRGNNIEDFTSDLFTDLKSLEHLYTDSYTFCCMASSLVSLQNCLPPEDEISSCEDLMSSPVQRSFLWVLGIIGLMGNLFVIIWRLKTKDSSRISSTLILNLGCADFLMGIYLIIIASVDVYYRSIYIENSEKWKKSTLCKICGFLSTVSTEVSVCTLAFITLDRLICLCFPLSQRRFSLQFTYRLIAASWITAAIMAIIPLVVEPYFQGRFYARSGVCLALHITNHRPAGWEYSVGIFFCMNTMAFIFIVSAYFYMYITIRKSYQNMSRLVSRQTTENTIGRQMALIALTNSMCWFPIILMGLLAMSGIRIPGEAYSWIAIFVIPLNSATNPLIYTISSLHIQKRLLSRFGLASEDGKGTYESKKASLNPISDKTKRVMLRDQLDSRAFKPPHGYISLLQYLRTVPGLRPRHLLKISVSICKQLTELHANRYALGGIDVNAVFVSENSDGSGEIHVYVPDINAYKIVSSPINGMPDDTAVDMEEFGLLLKKMLRVYHVVTRSNDPMQGTAC